MIFYGLGSHGNGKIVLVHFSIKHLGQANPSFVGKKHRTLNVWWYIYLHEWLILMVNWWVNGKYISFMDPMGKNPMHYLFFTLGYAPQTQSQTPWLARQAFRSSSEVDGFDTVDSNKTKTAKGKVGWKVYSHPYHPWLPGIFTYMNGWILWFSCREIYQSHGLFGSHFINKKTSIEFYWTQRHSCVMMTT